MLAANLNGLNVRLWEGEQLWGGSAVAAAAVEVAADAIAVEPDTDARHDSVWGRTAGLGSRSSWLLRIMSHTFVYAAPRW